MTTRPKSPVSVRRLLFRWLLLPLMVLLVIAAVGGYPIALYPATAAYDWALMDTALSLSRLITTKEDNPGAALSGPVDILLRTDQFDHIYYSIHDSNGRLIAGDRHLTPPPLASLSSGESLYDSRLNNERIRVAARLLRLKGSDIIVQVAETTVKRRRLITQILTSMIVSEVLLVAAVVALVWFGIGRGLLPLQRLRREIEVRSHRDLRPVPEDHAPVEVQPVVQALNNLLRQLGSALHAQQQFVANAAHQLRTPLAGLRMQVEYGLQQENPAEWRRTLEALRPATERTSRLANQLLTLARAEVGAHQLESMRPLDLRSVVEEVSAGWMPRALARKIDLGLELDHAFMNGDVLLVGELLSNLIDNAISYTASGGRVTIRTAVGAGMVTLKVEDDGVGIPEGERERVFRRFHRVDGSPGEGCGLGLAIVQEIAHLHGGHAEILAPPGGRGTVIVARFPAVAGTA